MINAGDLQPDILSHRVANAVDVSGALDNCFFHSYAAHVLANKLPFPTDLFTPNPKNTGSPAEQLKKTFKGPDDLEIFNARHQQQFPGAEASEMLAEKTLVLGVLFREWFADQLLKNEAHKEQLFSNDDQDEVSFLKLIDAYRSLPLETVLGEDRMAPIYLANRSFFDKLGRTPKPNEEHAFRSYWNEKGYKNYCQYLAQPYVRVTFTDVDPVLKAQNVPYTLYSKQDGSITAHNAGDTAQPHFELAISASEEHYTLLKNNQTGPSLDLYAASLAQYKADREAILSMSGTREDKRAACSNMPSQLVVATCPRGMVANNPVQALIATVAEIKAKVSQGTLHTEDRPESTRLTKKEQKVLQETTKDSQRTENYQSYKEEVKKLIIAGRKGEFSTDSDKAIPTQEIENAEGLQGETDEDFAKRLQDAELRGSGLK